MLNNLLRLGEDDDRPPFDCGDDDLNEFFHTDSKAYSKELLAVTYVGYVGDNPVAYFSVLNDAIMKEDVDVPTSAFKRLQRFVPRAKRFRNMPAVKIGRLAVCSSEAGKGIRSDLLRFLKYWFTVNNKTGCRFMIVDAYNDSQVLKFYENNDFRFMTPMDEKSKTRIMYYDLIEFDIAE